MTAQELLEHVHSIVEKHNSQCSRESDQITFFFSFEMSGHVSFTATGSPVAVIGTNSLARAMFERKIITNKAMSTVGFINKEEKVKA